jgi:glycosyltransferase involved in cell wall biosynthesis
MTSVSVIIPARNAADTIAKALDALLIQSTPPMEVIVVDDGSRDKTADIAGAHAIAPRVLSRPGGSGPGEARNAGAAHARGEVIAFTDSDCFPESDWLALGIERSRNAELVQGAVEPVTDPGPFDRTIQVNSDRGLFETANLFVQRELFATLGGFHDFVAASRSHRASRWARDSGRGFGEDAVFGWRAKRLGATVEFAPEVVVRHAVFPGGPMSVFAERWRLRHFPALVRRVPELRDALFFGKVFLSRRTAAFDLLLGSIALALALGSVVPLLGALPFLWLLARHARRGGLSKAVPVAVIDLVGDLIGALSLAVGSVRHRRLVA